MRSRTPELRTPLSWGGPCWWFGHEWQQRYPRHVRRLAVLNARTLLAVYGLLNARRAPHCGRLIQGEAPRCLGNNRWSIRRSPKPDEDPSVPSAWFLNSRVECVPGLFLGGEGLPRATAQDGSPPVRNSKRPQQPSQIEEHTKHGVRQSRRCHTPGFRMHPAQYWTWCIAH